MRWSSAQLLAVLSFLIGAQVAPNDLLFPFQWGLDNTGQEILGTEGSDDADVDAPGAWAIHSGTSSVVMAIVGYGIQPHIELADQLLPGRATVGDPFNTYDSCSLGTHAAGIVGARRGNSAGIAGLAKDVVILPVRVLEECAVTPVVLVRSATSAGIEWAVDEGADIVLVLLAFDSGDQGLADAIVYAAAHNVLVIAPVGEGAGNDVAFPAAYDDCLAVSATNRFDEPWVESRFGLEVDVAAPGEDVLSTWGRDQYHYHSSTGTAAAFVAGTAALVMSYAPQLVASEVKQILIDSADDLGSSGWPAPSQVGRLNAERALQLASENNAPAIRFEHVELFPRTIPPGEYFSFAVRVLGVGESIQPGTVSLGYRTSPAFERTVPAVPLGDDLFRVTLPAMPCGAALQYWLSATGDGQSVVFDPLDAPSSAYLAHATKEEVIFADDFESPGGWTTITEGGEATKGAWTLVDPLGTAAQPEYDFTPNDAVSCYVTGQHLAEGDDWDNDVDGGPVRLVSPLIVLDAPDALISYAFWFKSIGGTPDELTVELSRDDGQTWELIHTVNETAGWEEHIFRMSDVSQTSGTQLRLRFSTDDLPAPGDSLTEAAIDEVRVLAVQCTMSKGDFDGNGRIDLFDYRNLFNCLAGPKSVAGLGDPCLVFDLNGDGSIALDDLSTFQNMFGPLD